MKLLRAEEGEPGNEANYLYSAHANSLMLNKVKKHLVHSALCGRCLLFGVSAKRGFNVLDKQDMIPLCCNKHYKHGPQLSQHQLHPQIKPTLLTLYSVLGIYRRAAALSSEYLHCTLL